MQAYTRASISTQSDADEHATDRRFLSSCLSELNTFAVKRLLLLLLLLLLPLPLLLKTQALNLYFTMRKRLLPTNPNPRQPVGGLIPFYPQHTS